MLTSKTFKLVAETIADRIVKEQDDAWHQPKIDALLDLAVDFAHHFQKENPRFDVSQFMNVVKGVKK